MEAKRDPRRDPRNGDVLVAPDGGICVTEIVHEKAYKDGGMLIVAVHHRQLFLTRKQWRQQMAKTKVLHSAAEEPATKSRRGR